MAKRYERNEHLGDVLVLGLGKSGKSAVRYCAGLLGSRVDSLFVAAGGRTHDSEAFLRQFEACGVEWEFGDGALSGLVAEGRRFDVCIASPGIPFWHDLYTGALGLADEVISEIEFAWRESDSDSIWVAITGTNGKTTTTSCCAHVLSQSGLAARAVGNIGDVCLDTVEAGDTQVYVAEVSSYQLHSTRLFAPDVAVMLNITPDHVHWHRTLEAYRDAKFKLLDNMTQAASPAALRGADAACARVAVLDATNDVVRSKVREFRQMTDQQRGFAYVPLGTADGLAGDMRRRCGSAHAAFIDDDGRMVVVYGGTDHVVGSVSALQVKGQHNASNALAAAVAAVALGVPDDHIARALSSFAPLEHRIEPCGNVAGVACYNDSKATNIDATVKALQAFPESRPIVLLGGDDKGTDLSQLVQAVFSHAKAAVCFGAAAERFAQALEGAQPQAPEGFSVMGAADLAGAFETALDAASAGDVVLLSPACASFDEFKSFEERGRAFKRLVQQRRDALEGL